MGYGNRSHVYFRDVHFLQQNCTNKLYSEQITYLDKASLNNETNLNNSI